MKIKLVDSTFSHENAIGLAGENSGEHPLHFQWDTTPGPSAVKVWTDIRLTEGAECQETKHKIGLLVESPTVARQSHKVAIALQRNYRAIFTHNRKLVEMGEPFRFYPLGGSWLKAWRMFPKRELVSLIVGRKQLTEGQKLRHRAAERFAGRVSLWGVPYTLRLESKAPMLRSYRYSIVIENGKEDWYFSEKLVDCISQGTIPIYWGCPDIGRFFDIGGIIPFSDLDELDNILHWIDAVDYNSRYGAAMANLHKAHQYRCAEDWIWRHHPEVLSV